MAKEQLDPITEQLDPITLELDEAERAAVLAAQQWTETIRVRDEKTGEEHQMANPEEAEEALLSYYDKATARAVDQQISAEENASGADRKRARQAAYRQKKARRRGGSGG